MKRYFTLIGIFLTVILQAFSDDVTFQASAPNTVINGQQFQLSFTVNSADARNFRGPSFTDFTCKFGPSTSQMMSTRNVNGKLTSESAITFTYVLQATKEGTFTIPAAAISVDGKNYMSNSVTINVLPPDKNAPAQTPSSSGNRIHEEESLGSSAVTSQNISSQDLFLRIILSKTDVSEQECIVASIKLFSRYEHLSVDGSTIKMPDFQGFLMQDIELPQSKSWKIEQANGMNYRTVMLRQFVLYPQRSGTINIAPAQLEATVGLVRPSANPFLRSYQEVKKTLSTSALKVNVRPLPVEGRPDSFSGGVGDFTFTSSLTPEQIKTNEALTLTLTVKGTGNMKLLKNPEVKFPADFELYDPKVDNAFSPTTSGFSGKKTIEYVAIPRHTGHFVIPPVEFSYYDLKTKSYKTIKTHEYAINVEKGTAKTPSGIVSNYTDQENVRHLGEDIRYIKTGDLNIKPKDDFLFGGLAYGLCFLLPALASALMFFIFRKQAKENANLALVRTKKANKVANRRLKKAADYLRENRQEAFFEETLKALWGYLSDKLNMPLAQLTKENVEAELSGYGVDNDLIKNFLDIIHICEFARYAPITGDNSMEKVYDDTTDAINKMENTIKKSKQKS
ncbi:MAG: BatD family protein [Bacteroidales bacterium]|jgi:hypothetical protein|nr:BatD family protein [Bacteroidales bacterium]